ncbi:GNAT family N-acetyltransferase [Croceivirga radicis]|uniref:GNAT family N-acetyltransferase n=1 Tax=Croceivirga radicis TaxID=1929488 RepID=UPI000255AF54|nr:GNAT family N-acetyltransferase [Croceivirga radicis]
MEITIKEQYNKGYAVATIDGKRAGVMTYSIPKGDFIIVDHTEVDSTFKGQGVGKELLYKVVAMAREKHIKILPLCPFANAMFKKLDAIKDVLKS